MKHLKKNIVKTYIIGKNINFFKKQIQNKTNCYIANNIKDSIIRIIKDIKSFNRKNNTVLLSPASASYDQFLNFEDRGNKFKKISIFYAKKYL